MHAAVSPGYKTSVFLSAYIILGAFEKFAMSICPSAWNNSVSTARIFMKFGSLGVFENLLRTFNFNQHLSSKIC
jgi:hypothetical protein